MKNNFIKLTALFMSLLLILSVFAGCGSSGNNSDEAAVAPLLYKVSDDDGNVIWLFGSIHIGREEFYPLPEYVIDAYESSDALAVELDMIAFEKDMSAQMKVLKKMMYTDGTTIEDHIPEDLYESAVEILTEADLYNAAFDMYMPSLWYSLVDNALLTYVDADADLGIDMHLLNRAYEDGKEILEVESAEFQYEMLSDFSDELQVLLLENSVAQFDNIETGVASYEMLLDIWAEGNEDKFSAYLSEPVVGLTEEEEELYEEYNDALIRSRNDSMTEYAEDALESGKEVFICVGAAHVVGEDAMADQLRDLGYTVEIVK